MEGRDYWLKCTSVTSGMLPGEKAVEAATVDGRKISMFVPDSADVFRPDRNLIRVIVLDQSANAYLVYLPVSPLEVSSRCITVPRESVVPL